LYLLLIVVASERLDETLAVFEAVQVNHVAMQFILAVTRHSPRFVAFRGVAFERERTVEEYFIDERGCFLNTQSELITHRSTVFAVEISPGSRCANTRRSAIGEDSKILAGMAFGLADRTQKMNRAVAGLERIRVMSANGIKVEPHMARMMIISWMRKAEQLRSTSSSSIMPSRGGCCSGGRYSEQSPQRGPS